MIKNNEAIQQVDASVLFWMKVERIFGEIPKIIRMILEYNGFDSYLALKGIQWDDKKYFFQALEESVAGIAELSDDDTLKIDFKNELPPNAILETFKLKLGHKNLIINLCHELQKTTLEEFNQSAGYQTTTIQTFPDHESIRQNKTSEVMVIKRKLTEEEHGYSRENEQPKIKIQKCEGSPLETAQYILPDNSHEMYEQQQVQYIYEDDEDQFIDQSESEYIDDGTEIVEYHEVVEEDDIEGDAIYNAEEAVKQEADAYEHINDYEGSYQLESHTSHSMKNSKKPKHMYAEEFLQEQNISGKIGTPGRRRPKLQKNYSSSEEGMIERWIDLVRQSCQVIVPHDLLSKYDLSHIEIAKILPYIWEVLCPLCSKKIRLQLTHEGKYLNFKRSNFERHLRIVHYKQILKFKPTNEDGKEITEDSQTN